MKKNNNPEIVTYMYNNNKGKKDNVIIKTSALVPKGNTMPYFFTFLLAVGVWVDFLVI